MRKKTLLIKLWWHVIDCRTHRDLWGVKMWKNGHLKSEIQCLCAQGRWKSFCRILTASSDVSVRKRSDFGCFSDSGPGPVCSGFVLPWKALTLPEKGAWLGSAMRLRCGLQCVCEDAERSQRILITLDWRLTSGCYHVECWAPYSLFPGLCLLWAWSNKERGASEQERRRVGVWLCPCLPSWWPWASHFASISLFPPLSKRGISSYLEHLYKHERK